MTKSLQVNHWNPLGIQKVKQSPGQCKVVFMVFQGFAILLEVEVSIPQLAVDGTEGFQVFCANLDGSLKESRSPFEVPGLAQTFSFQSQLQAGGLHPKGEHTG